LQFLLIGRGDIDMKKIILVIATSLALIASLNVPANEISGVYKDKHGSTLKVGKVAGSAQYKITGMDAGGYRWESIGFYSSNCKCIKSVFKYTSHKDKYGDNNGFHKFEVKDNGKVLIKHGGWEKLGEFGVGAYSRVQ
jgi:hypothetical protein